MEGGGNVDNNAETTHFEAVKGALKDGHTFKETVQYYTQWAYGYDQDVEGTNYQAPQLAANDVNKLGLPKDIQILDVACGTGLVARILHNVHGFTNIHGLDACSEMIAEAKKLNIYKQFYCTKIGDGNTVSEIADNTYDCATFAGGLAQGHIKLDVFEELIRVCKSGGYIVVAMREEYVRTVKDYHHLDDYITGLEHQGLWTKVADYITPNYIMDLDGRSLVFQVSKHLNNEK